MPVTFHIPGPLRSFTAGQSLVPIAATPATLRDAIEALCALHPGLRDRLVTEQGDIREHINLFVGIEDTRYTGGLATPIPDGAEISIVPAISGGIDGLLAWRKEFPILATSVHMISHSLGAMPRRASERLQEYAETWSTRGIRAWEEGWWQMPVTVGDLIGRIIGAAPGETVIEQNVSTCVATVLSCFDWSGPRNKIVSEALNFPSNLYQCHALERVGARVATIPSPDGITVPIERTLAAIDGETQLVFVSHVLFRSSFIQDLAAITRRAHEMGALVLADIYQSAGTVPVDVHALDLDFATGGSVKWLCGGPGAAYLYVRRDLWPRLEPRFTGWMAHKQPFAFDPGPIDYAEDAFRFLNGTPAIPALYAARSGYEIIAEVGVQRIREKSVRQTARLIEFAQDAGFRVNSPPNPAERGGTVVIDVPNGAAVTKELLRRNFLVDHRPGAGIRVAPHFYSTDEELELTVREIRKIASAAGAAS